MRRLAFNSAVLTLGAYVAQGASILTYVLAARALGPSAFGPLLGVIGIATLVAGFGDFGINGWTIRALARNPSAPDTFQETLTAKLTIATVLAVLWGLSSVVLLSHSPLEVPVVLLAAYVFCLIAAGTLTVPFRASENMSVVSLVGAIEKLAALGVWVAMQAFVPNRPEITLPIALSAGGAASVVSASVFIPRRLVAITAPSIRQILQLWKWSYSFGMVGVSAGILRADVAIVNAIAGSYSSGVYAAPARITSFLSIIPSSFSAAVFPRIARSSASGASRLPEVLSAVGMLAIMVALLGVFALVAPLVIPLALGRAYLPSVVVFQIYLLVILVNAVNQPLLALLQAEGYEHYAGWAVVASALFGLATIGVGAFLNGAAGAAVGAVLLQLLQAALFARKAVGLRRRMHLTSLVAQSADGGLEAPLTFAKSILADPVKGQSGK